MNHTFSILKLAGLLLMFAIAPALAQQEKNEQDAAKEPETVLLTELVTGVSLWETTPSMLEEKFGDKGLQWLSEAKESARFFGNYAVFELGISCPEVVAEFKSGKLASVSVSLYNRGDAETEIKDREAFDKRIEVIKIAITKGLNGIRAVDRGKDNQSAVKASGWTWTKPPTAYLLEASSVREIRTRDQEFRPEFIRLRVAPLRAANGVASAMNAGNSPVSKSSLSENVKKEANGDVFIKDIPMVDQGPKGYCAVATAERVFRYYGLAVDQHELAQIANTSSGGGTGSSEMLDALNKINGRMKVRVRALMEFEMKDLISMVDDYNREARKTRKSQYNLPTSGMIDLGDVFAKLDPETLKGARSVSDKAGYGKFIRSVTDLIDKGVPVIWAVQLGIYEEPEIPQAVGGHMRLIIGYNEKTNELIYSDSWGAGHALKRMASDEARAMTTGLYYMEPIR